MTKITIIGLHYSPEPSGNAPYTTSLARSLAAAGHTVTVIAGFPHYPQWRRYSGYDGWTRTETLDGVLVRRLRHYIPSHPTGLRRAWMEVTFGLRVLGARWGKPQVVIFVSPALLSTGLGALRARITRKKVPYLIWVQDLYSRGLAETSMAKGPVVGLARRLESMILGSASGVVAIHDRFKTYIQQALGLSGNVHVVRNWTHLPLAPNSGQAEFRKKIGWGSDEIIVLHAGNMGRKQGLENVVAAARIAEAKGSKVRFVLLGDGNQRASLERASHGLTRITFIDSLPDDEFQIALTAADMLLVNELSGVRDMSVPSKLTSYFNAGIPVLAATDAGSVTAEEIEIAKAGLRVEAGDPSALVEVAETLGSDPKLRRELGTNGLMFREDTLSEATATRKYDDLIQEFAMSRGL